MKSDDPLHGTASQKWRTVAGCSCLHCEAARASRRRNYKLNRRAHTDATKVSDHIDRLVRRGWTQAEIVAASGLSAPTVSETWRGIYSTVRVETAVALLAVTGPAPHSWTVNSIGTIRRIQALAALGWTVRETCRDAGLSERFYAELIDKDRATIARASADAITTLYEQRSMRRPSLNAHRRRTRTIAARKSWAPPLAWNDIEDPNEQPTGVGHIPRHTHDKHTANEYDPAVVDRILAGDWRLDCTPVEKTAVVAAWVSTGRSLNELERRTGWNCRRYTDKGAA